MQGLYKGIQKFQKIYFDKERESFARLSRGQSPDVLFFSCLDSRVNPNLLTQSELGELLIVRNVGNIIPPYISSSSHKICTAAAIEFALLILKVRYIIVCGHSDCGSLKALYYDEKEFADMPNLKEWLDIISHVKGRVVRKGNAATSEKRKEMTEKEHIIVQLENLLTYPLVERAIREKRVKLQGWYYEIGTGEVYAYNWSKKMFEKINGSRNKEKELAGPYLREPCLCPL
ncbi:MAG: carbonic anhydrase [Deltaproteobacteria bacterium]|nr:carbonic anhydrase [Deltaproteobacteria bacterium]